MSRNRRQIRDEITGLLIRGGLIGLAAFAVAIAFMVVPRQLGNIAPTETVQTGPRGTGMAVVNFDSDRLALAALSAAPEALDPPFTPEEGEETAGEIYENVQVLGHLTDANFNRLMVAITEWVSPEQGCAYCHGEEGDFASDDYYPKLVAREMIEMTWAINSDWDAHVAETGVTCYTCHRGNNVPLNGWWTPVPLNTTMGPTAMYKNRATAANYSTALPVDALQAYFAEGHIIAVNDQAPRADGDASIHDTYHTYALMLHFSNSLGVNCTYCHNTRAIADPTQATPAWATAQIGIGMVQDINASHILPTAELLPPERLDVAGQPFKVNCTTCHQGAAKPLLGQSMLPDWPELVSEQPVYQ